jgi:hypothetical protein
MGTRRRQIGRCAATAIIAATLSLVGGGVARAATWDASAIASHAMIYLNSPPPFKEAMFREAAASGATSIRVDIPMMVIVTGPSGERSWSELDDVLRLGRKYRLEIVGLLYGTPWWLADCPASVPDDEFYRCPPHSAEKFARYAGEIARRTRGEINIWQVLNEPNNRFVFSGDVHDYARVLLKTSSAIRRANPAARIVLGGLGGPQMQTWPARLLAIPGTRRAFDVASVHLRGRLRVVRSAVGFWRRRLDSLGFRGPIWATEHGYPTDPEFQWDSKYRGVRGQARYLSRSLPTMIAAGVDRTFITLRDNRGGPWATEGLVGGTVFDPPSWDPQVERKPAAFAVHRFAMTLLAPTLPGRAVAAPPSLAQAPTGRLRANRRCYRPGEVIAIAGSGFAPGRRVHLTFRAKGRRATRTFAAQAPLTPRADGSIAARYRTPEFASRTDRRGTLTVTAVPAASDEAQPPFAANAASLPRLTARLGRPRC